NYLKYKAEEVIVPKANSLARLHKLNPASITVKKLRSRWGSCDHGKNIKLSLYLYSLPEELWNYVLCHELAHLEHLNHSRQFWNTVESMYPNYKSARKSLKDHAPGVYLF
ncbi:M48 family metallopeptidase, partial [Candidatus Parcubacteria bacterium]|nr:M48 family metallopeptidase [Candidatus Parcubacteria bacterium]